MQEQAEKIKKFFTEKQRMPSYAELAKLLGYASKNAAYYIVEKLEEQGIIAKDGTGKMIPGRAFRELKVLGLIEAGFPEAAEEDVLDTMSLDEYLIPNKTASFMLKVKGYSMKDAGIVDGDMVIVERTTNPKPGTIVIAEVDGAWTMKYYRVKNGQPYLEAANPAYKPIYPQEDLKVTAVVKAVIRKYQ